MIGLVLLAACDSIGADEAADLLVVEAFLYAGEPVDSVRLTEAVPLDQEDSTAVPVNDAEVRLIKEGVSYALTASDVNGYYHYSGDDLSIEAGDRFRLEVTYAGQRVTAETTVPSSPEGVALSSDQLEVPDFSGGFGGFPGGGGNPFDGGIAVTWNNLSGDPYYVVVESTADGEPESIIPDNGFGRLFGGFRLINLPTRTNYQDINTTQLEVLGPHRVLVYRINDEYAALYENRQQDSRDLNEPPTNIEGGLGIFTAFSSVSAAFEVVREN
jgi:hypothetical protein